MKKILIITLSLVLMVIFSFPMSFAEDKKVKYAVTINIAYNALSIAEANKIVADALEKHKEACKVDVKIEKAGNNFYTISDSDLIVSLQNAAN